MPTVFASSSQHKHCFTGNALISNNIILNLVNKQIPLEKTFSDFSSYATTDGQKHQLTQVSLSSQYRIISQFHCWLQFQQGQGHRDLSDCQDKVVVSIKGYN